ncbi:MAG: transcription termination/antitermination factor NusG [Kiritimatiellae bacterium]|jgi:transcriptional antiterminator NusG|nr:transcription termination/antitermination factor NusG [Kiritimatiellia bacterium]MBR0241290.1 transcription termination/antitermination factor NusG [Kiritimatiellia bacterium]
MVKQWFVLHTLTGQENKAQKSIEARVKLERMEEYIGRCVIPTERVTEKKDGRKRTITKKFFPGYVLAELALYDEAKGLDENGKKAIFERTWQFLRETPGVIGFVGGDRPQPLKQSEVDSILLDRPSAGAMAERPKVDFSVDETVKINDGAFMGLTGQVSMVDPDKGKLKVEVAVFGRKVPVDVEYWQVEKVPVEETLEPIK